ALPGWRIPNLPDPHILVPDGNVFALLEAQAEQPVRGVERRLYDPLELEIRLDRRLIHIAAQLAQLLGIIAPVPGGELEVLSLRLHQLLQRIAVGDRMPARRLPHLLKQRADRKSVV